MYDCQLPNDKCMCQIKVRTEKGTLSTGSQLLVMILVTALCGRVVSFVLALLKTYSNSDLCDSIVFFKRGHFQHPNTS